MAQGKTVFKTIKDVPQQKWERLAEKKIFFAHQSVGFNIIEGIKDVMEEYPQVKIKVLEGTKTSGLKFGGFLHAKVGKNRNPSSKIVEFQKVIEQSSVGDIEVAMLKFCYVDVDRQTDVMELLENYRIAVRNIQGKHPGLKIIHFTMPLRTQEMSWKTKVKLLIGKEAWEVMDNVQRNEFNKILLSEYYGKEPVFDIARFEATNMEGSLTSFKYKGKEYLALNHFFSSDGGHLNKLGRKMIAEKLLIFLLNEI